MSYSATIEKWKGEDVIRLSAGTYTATIAPFLGSNVIRMQDSATGIDFFRNDETRTIEEIKADPVTWGFPTLYLHNRLSGGRLKCSDHTYQFPINEPAFGNAIHGFLHQRAHTIVSADTTASAAVAKTSYTYDEKDPMFETFPVKFRADYTFSLEANGLHYSFTMTNLSDVRQLPFGMCNHTAFKGPFVEDSDGMNVRLYLPIGEKWEIDGNRIPTLDMLPHGNHDRQYMTGSLIPVKQDIDNDTYSSVIGDLDGREFRGAVMSDVKARVDIVYEVTDDFKFWIVWNDEGEKEYFCVEPMTWMIDAPNLPIPGEESGYLELAPGESKTVKERVYARKSTVQTPAQLK
ncbi:MAG: aldose 1-epimerase [Eubacterium sp.]|nr:aldose 1-epimerase [Eubacterium sp.]